MPDRYAAALPDLLDWISQTLDVFTGEKHPVTAFHLKRLPHFFPTKILNTSSVVITTDPPKPPLSSLGLSEFAAFEQQPISGITYLDTYFVTPNAANDESVHFHELVHVVQWKVLRPEEFLLMYAAGLAEYGYLDSPLERMAYDHQARFDSGDPPYAVDIEATVQTLELRKKYFG